MEDDKKQQRRRIALVIFAALYTFLYIGAFFGWGPMQLLLEENGSFASKCTTEEQELEQVCPAQTTALINVQLIAQITQITSPLLGQVVDHFGAPILAYCMAGCVWIGLILLIIAAEYGPDQLLYVSFVFLAMTTWMGGLLSVQTGMYFTGQTRSRVIFALNALFDAGSITYLGLWGIYEGTGASLTVISLGYLALAVLLFGGGVYFWKVTLPVESDLGGTSSLDSTSHAPTLVETEDKPHSELDLHSDSSENMYDVERPPDPIDDVERPPDSISPSKDSNGMLEDELSIEPVISSTETEDDRAVNREHEPSQDYAEEAEPVDEYRYVVVAERTTRQQLTSKPFLFLTVFWTIHVTANQWTLTTTRDFLASLGDDEVGNKYLTIFTLLMPASLAGVPFVDAMIVHFGFVGGFHGINVLALEYNLVRLTSDNLNVQIVGFILFSFFRSFLFGVSFSFLPTLLAPNVVGKATGLLFAITGVTAFLNIPLANFTIEDQDGDFFISTLIYTILVLPCIVAAWGLGRAMERDRVCNEERLNSMRLRESYSGVLVDMQEADGI